MKPSPIRVAGAALLALFIAASSHAQPAPPDTVGASPDTVGAGSASAAATAAPAQPVPTRPPLRERMYYGGSIGFSFWSDFYRVSVEPLVGFKVKPKLSVGGKLRYEYINDKRGVVDYDSHNYGASVFSRYRLVPQLYAHGEYAYMNYDYPGGRQGVPFLLLGGGYSQPMGRNMWSTVEVLWDVLNDKNSPYESGQPVVSIGVGVGF